MFENKKSVWTFLLSGLIVLLSAGAALAAEVNIQLPNLAEVSFMGGETRWK